MKKVIRNILCFVGLHQVSETVGIYQYGSCDNCGATDMWF